MEGSQSVRIAAKLTRSGSSSATATANVEGLCLCDLKAGQSPHLV